MSTNAATIDARRYRIRLVQPDPAGAVTFLGRTYSGRFLPTSFSKDSSDFVEGSWTRRFGDAGAFELVFPNVAASDDVLWRERFSPDGALQWVEIYRELDLEFVGVIERVDVDRGRVAVSGSDGMALLKRAYERDRYWVSSPRDVIHHYTGVPVMVLGEEFNGVTLPAGWSESASGATTSMPGDGTWTAVGTGAPGIASVFRTLSTPLARDTWRLQAYLPQTPANGGGAWNVYLSAYWGPSLGRRVEVIYGSTKVARVYQFETDTGFEVVPSVVPVSADAPLTLTLEAQGRTIRGFVNGQLIGYMSNGLDVGGDPVFPEYVSLLVDGLASGERIKVDRITLTSHEPFLQDATPGGYGLAAGELPGGGLRGRYWNDLDLSGLVNATYVSALQTPDREPYGERLDSSQSTSAGLSLPMQPGMPSTGYYGSQRWTGSVYLNPGVSGVVSPVVTNGGGGGFRIQIGSTKRGSEAFNAWQAGSSGGSGAVTLTDGAGWYPIVVERFGIDSAAPTWVMQLNVAGTGTYTDPGGTVITRGTNFTVPATSLSPLGIFEDRVQGQSHFDLVTQIARENGLELLLEPRSLESGQFPGLLEPRLRIGRDTDLVLTVEEDERGTPILSPGATVDSTEQTVHLIGNAQGIGGGQRGSVTAELVDVAAAGASLFQLQSWVDAGDIGFPDLLAARLSAELALRVTPWQEVRGNPYAQDRLADSFPLSGVLAAFRWTPGDGIRVRVPEIGVDDPEPRRITQLTRSFGVNGRTGAQVSFRNRPRGPAVALGQLARASLKGQRARTQTIVTVDGQWGGGALAPGAYSDYARCYLMPEDVVVRGFVRIPFSTIDVGVEVNGVVVTTQLGGPWIAGPFMLDLKGYGIQRAASDTRFYVRIYNAGAASGSIEFQVSAEVLR